MLLTCFEFPLALLTSRQCLLPFRSNDACDVLFCVLSQWFLIVFVMLLFLGFPYEGGGVVDLHCAFRHRRNLARQYN